MKKKTSQCKTFDSSTSDNETRSRIATTVSLLVMSIALLLSPIIIAAQAVSGVTGVVTDANGALVPGVQVILADPKTSREFTTTTNDQGVYNFNNIQPGEGYRLTFTRQGFQTVVISEVNLGIGRTETQNAQLAAGDVSATVQVTSAGGDVTLNTTDASVGNVIGERQLRELPIQLRNNPAALIGLQPGVIGNNIGTGATNRVGSVTGSRADQGNITVDGIDSNDQATGQAFVSVGNVPIDSIQEFRAVTSSPNASEGRSSGGQIQLATRSGNNDFHGSLREYFRTDKTAANSFFNNRNGVARPKLERHQFGGSLSGPLPHPNFGEGGPMFKSGRDKLFFFFDYEGRRDDSQGAVSRTVPLQHFREGRIGYINNNPGCTSASRLDTTPNCISFLTPQQVAALDPRGTGVNQGLLSFINSRYPLPNDLSGGNGVNTGLFRFNAPNTRADNTYTSRIDANITKTQTLFARATITRRDITNAFRVFPEDEDAVRLLDRSYQWVVGHTWVINPSFTNQATVGVSRQIWEFPAASSPAFPNSFTGGGVLTSPFAGMSFQDRNVLVPTIRNDSTWIAGNHTIQFGAQFKPISQRATLVNDFNFVTLGGASYSSVGDATLRPGNILLTTGAVGNFDAAFAYLLGRISSLDTNFVYDPQGNVQPLGSGRKTNYIYNEYEFYLQDNWRIRSDLTINLGVRYHLYPAPYEESGFQAGHEGDFENLIDLRYSTGAAGTGGPSSLPFLSYNLIGKANNGRPIYETDKNNFAPRIGFNWNPSFQGGVLGALFGDRKTAIRGGYNMQFDRVGGAITFIQNQLSYLFDNSASSTFGNLNPRTALLNDPRFISPTTLPVVNTAPTITRPFVPFVDGGIGFGLAEGEFNYAIDQNFKIPYSHQWNFGIQRQLPGDMIIDVSYAGRMGRDLLVQADASQVFDFRDPTSNQFMLAAFNALQAELEAGVPVANVTRQPWLENQMVAGINTFYGANTCGIFGAVYNGNCTRLVANFFGSLAETGGTADLVQNLYFNGLLNPNVGMGSQFAVNAFITNLGRSDYHGMLVSLQKRFSRGFQFDVNYTWSHALDNQSSVTNAVTEALLCDVRNPNACRGDSDFDIRHLFNANVIWDLPFGRNRAFGGDMPKWLDAAVGGWTFSTIFQARSGLPVTANSGAWSTTYFNADNAGVPAVFVGDPSLFKVDIRDEGTGIQYFADPTGLNAALRYPRHGEVGGRNTFRGQYFWTWDAALSKKFTMPWSENHKLTLRAEAYNLTNTNFFALPNLLLNSTTFGRVTGSSSTPRELQFAIRYDF